MTPAPEAGVYENVPASLYHSWNCANVSSLKAMAETSPHHMMYDRAHPEPMPEFPPTARGAALDIGTAWHVACLQPDKYTQQIVDLPALDFRKKSDLEWFAAEKEKSKGKTLLRQDSAEIVHSMAYAFRKDATAKSLLDVSGRVELSVVWITKTATGRDIKVKIRVDKLCDGKDGGPVLLVDLKSSNDASRKGFQKQIFDRRYHWQAGLYMAVVKECDLLPNPEGFVFAVQEKDRDFQVACYGLDDNSISWGEHEARKALDVYLDCELSREWPSYAKSIQSISLPAYAFSERI